ncbi:hypothetical protein WS86_15200 [Burkholderia savannae]|uniref:hypothetical protein n=1 Tax=Burkholderia savannae TaxID=1637837 RepID=UPI00075B04E6|nr:hypothetical protein [Burkholderia savannae]AOJ81823.1 hypothetical protein WS86_15200 [Burkholderia savannae]
MPIFQCVDKHGNLQDFEYKVTQNGNKVTFLVTNIPPLPTGDFFQLTVEHINAALVRIVMLNHHHVPAYSAKGIPDALLPIASQVLGKTVQSSPTSGAGAVYRTDDATIMWKRLEAKGMATYDPQTDIYTLI